VADSELVAAMILQIKGLGRAKSAHAMYAEFNRSVRGVLIHLIQV
jgi:hypothetical protein